jgi:hypothetical protein
VKEWVGLESSYPWGLGQNPDLTALMAAIGACSPPITSRPSAPATTSRKSNLELPFGSMVNVRAVGPYILEPWLVAVIGWVLCGNPNHGINSTFGFGRDPLNLLAVTFSSTKRTRQHPHQMVSLQTLVREIMCQN